LFAQNVVNSNYVKIEAVIKNKGIHKPGWS
jgi:hypothetical protein